MTRPMKVLGLIMGSCIALVFIAGTCFIVKKMYSGSSSSHNGSVVVLDLTGVIADALDFNEKVRDAVDGHAKALVIRVNSPGGLVAPSQEIYKYLVEVDKKIPVVISMSTVAASGGYYVALGGRKVWANPGTLTGSIGVIMEFANTEKLYNWAKVERFAIKTGKFKDIGSPNRAMTPEEKAFLQVMLGDILADFRGAITERRGIDAKALDTLADGRIFTGNQAKGFKLVDELGGLNEAIADAKKLAGLPADATVSYPETQKSLLRKLVLGDEASTLIDKAQSLLPPLMQEPGWRVLLLANLT